MFIITYMHHLFIFDKISTNPHVSMVVVVVVVVAVVVVVVCVCV